MGYYNHLLANNMSDIDTRFKYYTQFCRSVLIFDKVHYKVAKIHLTTETDIVTQSTTLCDIAIDVLYSVCS